MLKEYCGSLQHIDNWEQSVLKSMDWVTTGRVEPSEKFLEEEKFIFQQNISTLVLEHGVPLHLVHNLDQRSQSLMSLRVSTHFHQNDQKML